jgi:hypothetical protein
MSYQNGDVVIIHSTKSKDLDGQICKVVGRSYKDSLFTSYIIELQHSVISDDGFINDAISITEYCLNPN